MTQYEEEGTVYLWNVVTGALPLPSRPLASAPPILDLVSHG